MPELPTVTQQLAANFNGVVLAERDGQIVVHAAYGEASKGVANTPGHRFRIGSVTKTFTSAMIARLEEQGKLAIDDPLSKYIADFPGGETMTLRHLVDHRSGVGDLTQKDFQSLLLRNEPVPMSEVLDLLRSKKSRSKPGATQVYNNAGYLLLGAVIERVTGKNYADAVRDELLTPLGMTDTGAAAFDSDIEALATGHRRGMKTDSQRYNFSGIMSAGGMFSTTEDLHKWARVLNSIGADWYRKEHLGWKTGKRYGRDAVWHTGNTNTYGTLFVWFPGEESCLIVLSNEAVRGIPSAVRALGQAVFEDATKSK